MKKKEYIKPELNVYLMETQDILVVSGIKKAEEVDYDEDVVDDYRDTWGTIWAD